MQLCFERVIALLECLDVLDCSGEDDILGGSTAALQMPMR